MSVLTVVTRENGSLPLARFGRQLARALETELVVLCVSAGDESETAAAVPGAELPEDADAVAAAICDELRPSPVPAELLPAAADDGERALSSTRPSCTLIQ